MKILRLDGRSRTTSKRERVEEIEAEEKLYPRSFQHDVIFIPTAEESESSRIEADSECRTHVQGRESNLSCPSVSTYPSILIMWSHCTCSSLPNSECHILRKT